MEGEVELIHIRSLSSFSKSHAFSLSLPLPLCVRSQFGECEEEQEHIK